MFKEIMAGVYCIILGVLVFFGFNYFTRLIGWIGEGFAYIYFEHILKDHSRVEKYKSREWPPIEIRIVNRIIKGVGVLFVIVGIMYLISLLFLETA